MNQAKRLEQSIALIERMKAGQAANDTENEAWEKERALARAAIAQQSKPLIEEERMKSARLKKALEKALQDERDAYKYVEAREEAHAIERSEWKAAVPSYLQLMRALAQYKETIMERGGDERAVKVAMMSLIEDIRARYLPRDALRRGVPVP